MLCVSPNLFATLVQLFNHLQTHGPAAALRCAAQVLSVAVTSQVPAEPEYDEASSDPSVEASRASAMDNGSTLSQSPAPVPRVFSMSSHALSLNHDHSCVRSAQKR